MEKADWERKFGLPLSRLEVRQLERLSSEHSIRRECRGLPCRIGKKQHGDVVIEYGRLHFVERECEYAIEERLTRQAKQAGIPSRYAERLRTDYEKTTANAAALEKAADYMSQSPYGGCICMGAAERARRF